MKKQLSFSSLLITFIVLMTVSLKAQQFEVITSNYIFETPNSLTFDVSIKNTGLSNVTYSHGAVAWTYDMGFLNGGVASFSLVPGFSDFPTGAHPPSALITSPNILRTSSNMPGANGVIQPGENLRLYRFRFQTSASSFSSDFFNLIWKNDVTPYTRIYSWNPISGLPEEISALQYSIEQLILDENFDYGAVSDTSLVTITSNWIRHSGSMGPAYSSSSLNYASYASSGIGGSATFTFGSSGNNDGDIHQVLPAEINTDNNVYAAFLVNLTAARANADYFFHLGPSSIGTTFRGRVSARSNGEGWSFGLSKSTETRVDDNTVLNFDQTYLVVLKYSYSTATTSDDVVTLYVYDSGIPASEPGLPLVTIGPTGSGAGSDPANIGSVAIRQGGNTPTGTIDGIRVGTTWASVFSVAGSATLTAIPTSLSGFSYLTGSGPSVSQSYNLSGADLTPASGNIIVTGSTNYEVSLNNSTFSSNVNVPYSSGALAATPVYVRLKSGLPSGIYDGEIITNSGGGATDVTVICNGAVAFPEPTNHVTNFAGVLGVPSYYLVNISWTDAAGGTEPDGYLIRISDVDFASIPDPVDGIPVANTFFNRNVAQGEQAVSLGFNSAKTYYFKIFPYTNSGSLIDYKTDGTIPQFNITIDNAPTLPVVENFDYTTGTSLTENNWIAHSAGGTNPILVNDFALNYSGYASSGLGKSVTLATSGEDVNRAFDSVTTGSVYASFMANVISAQTNGDYFFHLGLENSSSLFYAKVFVKIDAEDNIAFGIAKRNNTDVIYTPFDYALNTTYLIAVKYSLVEGTTVDDEVSLWINPVLDGNEPLPTITQTDAGIDATSLGMFALRQGSVSNAAVVTVGGIRVANSWIPGSSGASFQLTVNVEDGWNMLSIPGLHPVDQNVNTWWQDRNPAAQVFKFDGGYQSVTDASPGEGYWMLHVGNRTYNTGDEWPAEGIQIVPNEPISGNSGWNLIGGYEITAATSGITTDPSGLQQGSVFGYTASGGYAVASNLVPGYAYWLLLSASGQIILPTTLAKAPAAEQLVKEDWGRIMITDNSGKRYTLYGVNGEVELNNYLLPPQPPAGMFDVRYTSGRYAEEISSSAQTVEMSGVEYPVTVRVEGMAIRVQDESGKVVNTLLKSGEEVVISNPMVGKLKVSSNVIPEVYALEQNYPNPFNPATTIEFSIPEDVENVKLTIYNALGQKVVELVNGKLEAGRYNYQWDASSVASGLYIYQLQTSKFTSTKKMMLMK
jgi:hypothetical protein